MVLLARLLMVVAIAIVLFDPQAALAQQKQATAVGSGGAAASVDLAGTQAAIRTLRQGGNAVDAAVAAAGVLGVTEPFSCGIGGGGFMVIRTSKGKITTIDGREESPRSMRPDSFWENGAPLAFNEGRYSGMSAGIPGTPATWERALDRYGTWSLARALRPGIRVASDGFTVDQTFFDQTTPNIDWFNDIPSTAAIYLDPDGTPRDVGTTLQNPDLARTYRLLGREGVDAFYRGELASAMAERLAAPAQGRRRQPRLAPGPDDHRRPAPLPRHRAQPRPATAIAASTSGAWARRRAAAPPSARRSTSSRATRASPPDRVRALHLMLESSRYTFADRNAYLADPDFFDVPLAGLLSDSFAAERRALITRQAATSPVAPGDPYDNQKGEGKGGQASATISHPRQSTTHLVVSDSQGQRRLLHVHDRVDRRQRGRRARLRLPHEQRADRLQLRLAHAPEPRRRRQAPAQLDEPDDHHARRQAVHGGRLAGRLDDPGHGAPGAARAARPRLDPARGDRAAARRPAERRDHHRRAGLHQLARGPGPARARALVRAAADPPLPPTEIGAVTGIEFLSGGRTLAAAEPVRRGGGSAAVVEP